MANPRRKISKSKRDKRRTSWKNKMEVTALSNCSNCGEVKVPHRACPSCGYYNGQQVFTQTQS